MEERIINWIKDYVEKSNANGVVIGNSGGKDSATVIALCVKALGKDKVLAVEMPCNGKAKDVEDGIFVANTLGVNHIIVNLDDVYNNLEKSLEIDLSDEAKINIKPRLRMTALYAIAATYGYLVAGTGNLCEQYVGYTTKWGDSASDFNPIANLTVEEVINLGKKLGVPDRIMEKAPSDGLSELTDEEKLGVSYSEIAEYIKNGKTNNIEVDKKIEELHRKTEHKRNPIPTFKP